MAVSPGDRADAVYACGLEITSVRVLVHLPRQPPLAVVLADDARERRLALGGGADPFGDRRLRTLVRVLAGVGRRQPPAFAAGVHVRAVDGPRLVEQVRKDLGRRAARVRGHKPPPVVRRAVPFEGGASGVYAQLRCEV